MLNFRRKNTAFSFLRNILLFSLILVSSSVLKAQNCTVNAGIPATICDNETMQLQGNSTGLFTTTASWSQVGGPSVSIADPNNLNSTVTGYTSGQAYTFRISATCQDGVNVYDEVTIDVNPVTEANAGVDQQSCPGTAIITLNGNSPGVNETGQWTIQSNGGSVGGLTASDPNSTLNLPETDAGNSILRWSINHSNGCSSYDEVLITNYGGVLPVSAGNDQTLGNCYTTTQSTNLSGSYAGDGSGGQQGTWSLVSGPNYPTIANANNRNTAVSNLVEGVYVFRWEVTGPCTSGSDEVTITVPGATQGVTSADAPNQRFCYGATTAILEGAIPQYANEVGTWVQTGGPAAIITSSNNATTSVTGLDGSSTYVFSYTITNSNTGCSTTHNNIYIRYTTAPTIDIGADQVLDCGVNSVTISPSVTGGTNTRYKIISGPLTSPVWIGDNSANVTINGLNQEGTYTIQFERYSVGSGCSSAFDVVNVSVADAATASNAGTDQNLACNIVETDLAGNAPSEGIGTWSQVSGPNTANIYDVYDRSSHIDNLIEGQYVFRWVISGGNSCSVEQDEVIVNVATSNPAAAAGNDRTVCHSTEVILEGNTPKEGAVGEWSVTPNTGVTFSNINDPSASVFGMQANTAYTFTWTITNQCQVESADVVITTGNMAGPSPAFAGPDQCEATGTITLSMDGNSPLVGQGLWTVLSGPNSPTITDNTLPTTSVTGMVDGHYEIEWSINVPGCVSTRDTIVASIVSAVTQSNAGADKSICGSAISLSVNEPALNETGHWEQVLGSSGYTVSDINDYNVTFTDLLPGRYEFAWVIEKGVCPSSSDTLVLTVTQQPDVSITASDYAVCSATTATLAANNPNSGTGVWSVVGQSTNQPNIASVSSPTTTVSNLATGTYNFRWTITSGPDCAEEIDEITIQVSAPAVADPNQTLCNVTETFLEGTEGTDGVWSISTSNTGNPIPSISNTSVHTANVSGMGLDETYWFTYTVPAIYGCSETQDSLTVSTSPHGTDPDAGPDQEICTNGGNSVTMEANAPGTGIGSWNQLSGPNSANIVNAASNITAINNLIAGIYVFEWNVEYGNCGNYSDIVRITVNDPPTTADAGTDQVNACQFDAQLSGNLPSAGIGVWTLISAPTASATTAIVIDNPNLPNSTISNITDLGDYEFMWTTTNGSVCAASMDNVILTFTADPPTAPNAGSDQDLCDATSFKMAGNNPAIGTGTWSQISGPGGILITNPDSYNTTITNVSAGTYEFQWEIVHGGCTLTDNVTIINNTTPSAADASGTDPEICQFDSPQLVGSEPSPGTGVWSFVSGPTTPIISTPVSTLSNVTGTSTGTYTFRWTVSNGACASSSDDIAVTIVNNPVTNITVSGNTVCDGADATVTISSSENLINYELFIGGNSVATGTGDGGDIDITVPASEISVGLNYVDITATNSTGCAVNLDNQATIAVNATPVQTNPVSNDEVCENSTATITISTSVSGVRYDAYSGVTLVGTGNGNGGDLDISIPTNGSWVGSNTISLIATNTTTSCVSNLSNNSTITVNSNPLTDRIVSGNTACLGQDGTVTVELSETGINYEAFIGATSVGTGAGNGGDLSISINGGDLVLGNNTIDLVATNATSSCALPLTNQATVEVVNPPLIDRSVNGNTVCQNSDGTVTISASETGVTYELYIGTTPVGTGIGTGSDLPITVGRSNLSVGTNTIHITASNTGCTESLTNQATINVNANPIASLSINGSELCDLLNGTITINSSETGIDYEAFISGTSVSTGTGDGADLVLTVLASDLNIGTNNVQVVATNSITNCSANMITTPIISVNSNPNYTVLAKGSTVCDEANASLTIESSEPGINYEAFIGATSIGMATGNGNDLIMNVLADDLIVGNNIVDVIASTSNNSCIGVLDNQATIFVNSNPLSDLQIGDTKICNGDTAYITISNSEQDISYTLFINDDLVGNADGNGSTLKIAIPYSLYEVGTSTVLVRATNTVSTCTIDMEIEPELIVEQCQIIVYNGFSPNDDGINETFIIEGLINYPNHKVTIFNRWGNKVYEASPYLNDWDGTNMFGVTVGGKDLPVGTYFYIIEPGNGEKAIKGYIYLNR
jgi:gliding motility-associated-like protein